MSQNLASQPTSVAWYSKAGGPPHDQGLIIDEATGRNVAVCYDSKDGPLIAAAPDLREALEDCAGVLQSIENQLKGRSMAVTAVLKKARAALAITT